MKFKIPYANNFNTLESQRRFFFLFHFPQLKQLQCLCVISHITFNFFFYSQYYYYTRKLIYCKDG